MGDRKCKARFTCFGNRGLHVGSRGSPALFLIRSRIQWLYLPRRWVLRYRSSSGSLFDPARKVESMSGSVTLAGIDLIRCDSVNNEAEIRLTIGPRLLHRDTKTPWLSDTRPAPLGQRAPRPASLTTSLMEACPLLGDLVGFRCGHHRPAPATGLSLRELAPTLSAFPRQDLRKFGANERPSQVAV